MHHWRALIFWTSSFSRHRVGPTHLQCVFPVAVRAQVLRCRWLLTNIRSRSGLSGRVSNHDLDSKIKELARLEEWLRNVRCEAIAVGACSLLCRRVREEVSKSSKHPFRSPCLDIQLPGKTEDCECDHIFMCMCMCCCMCMYVHLPVCAFGSSSM